MAVPVGIAQQSPTTMADLEPAAVLSKSVATAMRLPTVTPNPLHTKETKIAPTLCLKSLNRGHQHPGTQLYMAHYDDPMSTAAISHHEPTLPTTPAQHPTIHHLQRRILNNRNNLSDITINKRTTPLIPSSNTIIWHPNDPSSGARPNPQAAWLTLPTPTIPTEYDIPRTPILIPPRDSPFQQADFDAISAAIFDQLNYLEALVRAWHRPSNPTLQPELTVHPDVDCNQRNEVPLTIRKNGTTPPLPTRTFVAIDQTSSTRSNPFSDPTAPPRCRRPLFYRSDQHEQRRRPP